MRAKKCFHCGAEVHLVTIIDKETGDSFDALMCTRCRDIYKIEWFKLAS